jgi:hypothetical protein
MSMLFVLATLGALYSVYSLYSQLILHKKVSLIQILLLILSCIIVWTWYFST